MSEKMILAIVLVFILVLAAVTACKSPAEPELPEPPAIIANPSFSGNIQAIFNASCNAAGCHGGNPGSAGLNLATGQSYGNLVNVDSAQDAAKKRVLPGNAADSYLVIKLEGRQETGSRMPLGGTLHANHIQNIRTWIAQGAANN